MVGSNAQGHDVYVLFCSFILNESDSETKASSNHEEVDDNVLPQYANRHSHEVIKCCHNASYLGYRFLPASCPASTS